MIVSRPGVRGYLTFFPNIARRPLEKHVQMVLCRAKLKWPNCNSSNLTRDGVVKRVYDSVAVTRCL